MTVSPSAAGASPREAPSKTYSEVAYDLLRGAILRGELVPGDRLIEQELARKLGMSQGPIREALSRLRSEALIVTLPHKGSFVVEVSLEEARDIYSVRTELEPYVASLALPRMSDVDIEEMCSRVDEIVKSAREGQFLATLELDMAWHRRMFEFSGSPLLLRFWEVIEQQATKYMAIASPSVIRDPLAIAESHYPLADALKQRDLPRLQSALRAHVETILEWLCSPDAAAVPDNGGREAL
jgi:DNA-binding GntR family transcriptional regulator